MKKKGAIPLFLIVYVVIAVLILVGIYFLVKKLHSIFVEFTIDIFPLFFEFLWKGAILLLGLVVLGWLVEFGYKSFKWLWHKLDEWFNL